jgi:hypothetical protein
VRVAARFSVARYLFREAVEVSLSRIEARGLVAAPGGRDRDDCEEDRLADLDELGRRLIFRSSC